MNTRTGTRTMAALVLALAVSSGGVAAGDGVITRVTSEGTYAAASLQGEWVIHWLERQSAPRAVGLDRGFEKVGHFRVSYSRLVGASDHDLDVAAPGDGPPVPLPPSGSPGESITIERTFGGWFESWTYVWTAGSAGGGWMLAGYRYERVRVGPAPG